METNLTVDVTKLDTEHRRAFEDVIGSQLLGNQRLHISVSEIDKTHEQSPRPVQSLNDWTGIYSGLTDEQIVAIDRDVKTRADLTRQLQ
jgi:hypothetical protein